MSTYTDIRYDYNLPSGYGGAMKLISEQTASASASISFTSGIDSTYRTYMFKFINLHPSVDGGFFQFQGSTDGGSNYNTTITSTNFQTNHKEDDSSYQFSYEAGYDLAQSTSYQHLLSGGAVGNDNDQSMSGNLYLFSPSNTTYVKHFMSRINFCNKFNNTHDVYVAGYFNSVSALNAINFKFDSGNIDDGIIKMYGIA